MYLVTNRELEEKKSGLKQLGDRPSRQGPNELRLVEATKTQGKWKVAILPDMLTPAMKREVGITDPKPVPASRYVAQKVLGSLQRRKRDFLFFVHGYNNDLQEVVERALGFERTYNVEVMAFSWPANGGGLRGVASYLSDKRDALASVAALGRCFDKLYGYLTAFNQARQDKIVQQADARFANNASLRDEYITKQSLKGCPFTVNLVLHSMGNYLFKHVLKSSVHQGGRKLLFDNVVLAAADTNNEGHAEWIAQINCRKRIYITINENDSALMASRMKAGSLQKARLGHYLFNLDSDKATYVNFTDAKKVKRSHAYFENGPIRNPAVRKFFHKAFHGLSAEEDLDYDAARRLYLAP